VWRRPRRALVQSFRRDAAVADYRGYDSVLEAKLHRVDVPPDAYGTLVDAVRDERDALDRLLAYRRDRLGVDDLRLWDLLASLDDSRVEVPYEDAVEHVVAASAALGDGYQRRARDLLDGGRVDALPHRGKRDGAYTQTPYGEPSFVLLNYRGDVASMYTLAHEVGHAVHADLVSDGPYVHSHPPSLVTETASQLSELLLTRHLVESAADPALRAAALDRAVEAFWNKLYRHAMWAEFERRVYEAVAAGGTPGEAALTRLYGDLLDAYYGPVSVGDVGRRGWMRVSRLRDTYEVWTYAFGVAAAASVDRALADGDLDPAAVVDAFRAGGRDPPLDLLSSLGVSAGTGRPVAAAADRLDDFLSALDAAVDSS
jgi:oligoendopeptidase F